MTNAPSETSTTAVRVEPAVLGQLAYHVRCTAALAAGGRTEQGAAHAMLSWALLEALGGEPLRAAVAALDLPDDLGDVRAVSPTVRTSSAELALQLCSHFTSAGCHELAGLYQDAYQLLASR